MTYLPVHASSDTPDAEMSYHKIGNYMFQYDLLHCYCFYQFCCNRFCDDDDDDGYGGDVESRYCF